MKQIVDSFIKEFDSAVKLFTEGKCYYFAVILRERFGGTILYNPIRNHWACLIDNRLYDVTGEISNDGFEEWPGRFSEDASHYNRLVNQCITFTK